MADGIKEQIAELNEQLEVEYREWQKIKVAPPQTVNLDPFEITMKFNAMLNLLIEGGLIDPDEFTLKWKREALEYMRNVRPKVANALADAKKQVAVAQRQLFGPNGEILN